MSLNIFKVTIKDNKEETNLKMKIYLLLPVVSRTMLLLLMNKNGTLTNSATMTEMFKTLLVKNNKNKFKNNKITI